MKETPQPLGDFWDIQADKLKARGFDPNWVDQEMSIYREHSQNKELYPEGEAGMKRLVLPIINNLLKRD